MTGPVEAVCSALADRSRKELAEARERMREEQRREEEYWAQQAEEEARLCAEEEAYWAEQAASQGSDHDS